MAPKDPPHHQSRRSLILQARQARIINISSTPYPARRGALSYSVRPTFYFDVNLFLSNRLCFARFALDMRFSYELRGKSRVFCLGNGDCSSTTFLAIC